MNVASKFGKKEVVIIAEDVSGHVWRGVYFVLLIFILLTVSITVTKKNMLK